MLNFKCPSILWNCWTLLFGSHSNSKGREYMWTITQNQLCLTISTYAASIHLKKMVFNTLPNSQGIYSLRSTLNNPVPRPQPHTAESSEVALYSIHLSHCHGVYTHTPHPVQGSESHCLHLYFLTYRENLILLCFLLTFPSHIPTSFFIISKRSDVKFSIQK